MGCIVFDDQRLHSFPIVFEVTFHRWNVHIRKDINFEGPAIVVAGHWCAECI
jgi:hypothetical protein